MLKGLQAAAVRSLWQQEVSAAVARAEQTINSWPHILHWGMKGRHWLRNETGLLYQAINYQK